MKKSFNYKNVDYVDEKGNVKTKVEYAGKTYNVVDDKEYSEYRIMLFVYSLVLVILTVVSLIVDTEIMRTLYFTVPYLFCLPVLYFLVERCIIAWTSPFPYKEKEKKKITSLPVHLSIGVILSAVCVVGYIVKTAVDGYGATDILPLGVALMNGVSFFIIRKKGKKVDFAPVEGEDGQNEPESASDTDQTAE